MTAWEQARHSLAIGSPAEGATVLRNWLRRSGEALVSPAAAQDRATDYTSAFARVSEKVVPAVSMARAERVQAPEAMSALLSLPASDRAATVRREPRFQTWSLARLLGDASLRAAHDDPEHAVELGSLAVIVAESLSRLDEPLRQDLLAASYTCLGNAQRAASLFVDAHSAFCMAEQSFARSIGDPGRYGFLQAMRAALLASRSEFASSLVALGRARRAFREVGDAVSEARVIIQEADALFHLGRSDEAVRRLDEAASVVEPAPQPLLSFALQANRAIYLIELERFAEARRSVSRARTLLQLMPGRLHRVRLGWIEAELDAALGHHEAAERRLRVVREAFLAGGMSHEYAIVTLELALVLARSGRFAEAKEAAREAVPLLQSLGIAPETVLAVRLYAESSAAEVAQIALLSDLVKSVRRWRRPPPGG